MDRPVVITDVALSPRLADGLAARYCLRTLADAMADGTAGVARVLVTGGAAGADAATIAALPSLGLIANHGVGVDRIDLAAAAARGIAIANTPDVLTDDVADMAIALVLATMRRIVANDRLVRAGGWPGGGIALARRVTGRRFGIVGLGRIGRAVARRLEPFAGAIAYHNRRPADDAPYPYLPDVPSLAAWSDVLILAASGGAAGDAIVGAEAIDALGPDGVFVNIGRGGSVDEPALVDALVAGRLGGAGLDVFADEPHPPAALLALDRVVLQPHQASATQETRAAMADLVIANIVAYHEGRPLLTPL